MTSCVNEASKICGDEGYTILGGASIQRLLGGESSAYRTMSEMAELSIRCGLDEVEPAEGAEGTYALPARTDAPVAPAPPSSACTPGATQKCVGAGACQGGQVCAKDGGGFGPCDCGGTTPAQSPKASEQGEKKSLASEPAVEGGPKAEAPSVPGEAPRPVPMN